MKAAIKTINFPSVNFANKTAKQILATRQVLKTEHGVHHLYSDGSYQPLNSVNTRMSFAGVFERAKGEYDLAVTGTAPGRGSSTRAEIAGLLATILCCPRHQPATIHLDDLSTVEVFSKLIQHPSTSKQLLPSSNADWWKTVKLAYIQQGKQITVQWVHGHSGARGNVAADKWARKAHADDHRPLQLNRH